MPRALSRKETIALVEELRDRASYVCDREPPNGYLVADVRTAALLRAAAAALEELPRYAEERS